MEYLAIVLVVAIVIAFVVIDAKKRRKPPEPAPVAKEPEKPKIPLTYDFDRTVGIFDECPAEPTLYLTGLSGGAPYTTKLKSSGKMTVGRIEGLNDIVIPDGTISKQHCEFHLKGQQLCVSDLGSSNGTFIQRGDAVAKLDPNVEAALMKDDILRLGRCEFSVSVK
jgi:hypothetical protein